MQSRAAPAVREGPATPSRAALVVREGAEAQHKTVLVTGVARGGTSMVAGVVRELGIDLGSNLGPNHEDPQFLSTRARDIRRVVAERNAAKDVWGWKMPHAVDHLHRVERSLRNPFVIVVFRNTLAVVHSRMRRQGLDAERALTLTLEHQQAAGRAARRTRAALMLVDYEAALAEPDAFVDAVARFLHVAPTPAQREAASAMADPCGGYRRVSDEAWTMRDLPLNSPATRDGLVLAERRRTVGILLRDGRLVATAPKPFMEFAVDAPRCVLCLRRDGRADSVRINVDVGRGFSLNMAERARLREGKNRIEITYRRIRGVRIFPAFDDVPPGAAGATGGTSNVKLVRLLVPTS